MRRVAPAEELGYLDLEFEYDSDSIEPSELHETSLGGVVPRIEPTKVIAHGSKTERGLLNAPWPRGHGLVIIITSFDGDDLLQESTGITIISLDTFPTGTVSLLCEQPILSRLRLISGGAPLRPELLFKRQN